MTVRQGGLVWRCVPGWQARLWAADVPDWRHVEHDGRAKLVKANPLRRVFCITFSGVEVYAKLYRPGGLLGRALWLFRPAPSGEEFGLLRSACARGVAAARPIAWAVGRDEAGPLAILLTESLGRNVSLEDLIWQEPAPTKEHLARALTAAGKLLAQLHCAGMCPADLHTGNIVLVGEGDRLGAWLADMARADVEQRGGHPSANPLQERRLAGTAVLVAGMRDRLSRRQQEVFLRAYLEAMRPGKPATDDLVEDYAARLHPLVGRHDRRVCAARDRRALRNSRYAQKIRLGGGWTARVFLEMRRPLDYSPASRLRFTPTEWSAALADPAGLMSEAEGRVIKRGGRNCVLLKKLRVGGSQVDVVVKQSRLRRWPAGVVDALWPSRAVRHWRRAHALIARKLPTALPLAALERRRWGLLRESMVICEEIAEGMDLKAMLDRGEQPNGRKARRELILELAGLLAELRRRGLRHRDCKATNILVQRSKSGGEGKEARGGGYRVFLVDLDGLGRYVFPTEWLVRKGVMHRFWHEAVVRLAASLLPLGAFSRAEAMVFLRGYWGGLGVDGVRNKLLRKELWRCLSRRVAWKARHQGSLALWE